MNDKHFIQFRDIPLIYGRVPKVANSSIKAALCRLLKNQAKSGVRTTSDSFWQKLTNGQTNMLGHYEARMCRGTHFSFSFVRNPFDRLVSAYNNKILELDHVPGPMQSMGLTHGMPFGDFLSVVASTSDENLDVHLLPQCTILCIDGQLIPNFIGHLETMREDWEALQKAMLREGLPSLGNLPEKNVRRSADHGDVIHYFKDPGLIKTVVNRYGEDIERFYAGQTIEQLIKIK